MAWISLVIVVLLFYLPGNLSSWGVEIVGQDVAVPLSGVLAALPITLPIPSAFLDLPLPGTGVIRLFIISISVWAVLCLILDLFNEVGILPLFRWDAFKSGLLYAREPEISNNIAVMLAKYVVARTVIVFGLQLLKSVMAWVALGSFLADAASSLFSLVDNLLPPAPDPRLTVLCWFTVVAVSGFRPAAVIFQWGVPRTAFTMTLAYGFAGEQRQRHADQIRQNQLLRKRKIRESGELVLPVTEPS